MSVIYTIDAMRSTVRTRCIGDVTLQQVIDHFRSLERDADCPDHLHVFLDLSETVSLPDAAQIFIVADTVKKIRSRIQFEACAIVASSDALFGMMRMFEALAEQAFRVTCTFRAATEAEAWLALQQLPTDNKQDQAG